MTSNYWSSSGKIRGRIAITDDRHSGRYSNNGLPLNLDDITMTWLPPFRYVQSQSTKQNDEYDAREKAVQFVLKIIASAFMYPSSRQ